MSIFTIRPSAVCAAAVLAMASVGAQAASISFSAASTTPAVQTDWSQVLNLGKFDTNLGTLTSITYTLDGTVTGFGQIENTATNQSVSTAKLELSSVLTLSRPDNTELVFTNPVFNQNVPTLKPFDGTKDFTGESAYNTGTITVSKANSATSVSSSDFALFSQAGGGTIGLKLGALGTSFASGSGNIGSEFVTKALGTATVTYNYTAAVPEPETYALMLAGLGLMGAVARRRRAAR